MSDRGDDAWRRPPRRRRRLSRTISPRSATSRRIRCARTSAICASSSRFLGRYYSGAAWTWQGVDRLAMRGFLGAPREARARASARWRARSRRCAASIAICIATRSSTPIPARAVGAPKLEKYLPGYLDRAQIDLLFQMAEVRAWEGNFVDVRNLAILELFYSTGMRLSELQGLSRGDLDMVSQQVKVRGKGRKERIVPIGDHAMLALRNYESKRDELLRAHRAQGRSQRRLPRAHGQAHRRARGAEGRDRLPRSRSTRTPA